MDFIQHVARVSNWRGLALLGLLSFAGVAAHAQVLGYSAATAQNVTGTYTDLGTNGTAIVTANNDDATSQPQPIGFTFTFNSQPFTQFVLNTNGFIKLGTTGPSADNLTNYFTADPADVNIISVAGGVDLQAAANQTTSPTEYRVSTTGTAPNRVCTIQYKNVADKATVSGSTTIPAQFSTMQFQIKLYEGSNNIEFVYGAWTPNSATATGQPFLIGLKGSSSASANRLLASKPSSATAWSVTTFSPDYVSGGVTYLPSHFVRNTFPPDLGRTYRFNGALPNDAEVRIIYSLAQLSRSAGPHSVQAVVRNVGANAQTGVPVTLNITGANTYSNTKLIATLAAGASETVTFDPYTPANLGNNTITVSLLPDDLATNNTKTTTQVVTDNVLGYTSPTATTASVLGVPATSSTGAPYPLGALVSKFTTAAARTVTATNIRLESSTVAANTSVGRTIYGVVLNSTGSVLGRTPDYVIQSADLGASKTLTFSAPVPVAAGNFYVGLVQVNPTGASQFYPLATQAEVPTRPGTFFGIIPFSATGANQVQDLGGQDFGAFFIDAVLSTTTGVSKVLESAVSVYPNPSSNGQFTLELRGANAKGNLQVEVNNLLGQRVYTGSAKDNFENRLDLSHLANGLYTLKISQGDQYMTRTISIRK